MEIGANDFIGKPFRETELFQKIQVGLANDAYEERSRRLRIVRGLSVAFSSPKAQLLSRSERRQRDSYFSNDPKRRGAAHRDNLNRSLESLWVQIPSLQMPFLTDFVSHRQRFYHESP